MITLEKLNSWYTDRFPNQQKKECVGCHETENLTKCDGTMCFSCWARETVDEEVYQ